MRVFWHKGCLPKQPFSPGLEFNCVIQGDPQHTIWRMVTLLHRRPHSPKVLSAINFSYSQVIGKS